MAKDIYKMLAKGVNMAKPVTRVARGAMIGGAMGGVASVARKINALPRGAKPGEQGGANLISALKRIKGFAQRGAKSDTLGERTATTTKQKIIRKTPGGRLFNKRADEIRKALEEI